VRSGDLTFKQVWPFRTCDFEDKVQQVRTRAFRYILEIHLGEHKLSDTRRNIGRGDSSHKLAAVCLAQINLLSLPSDHKEYHESRRKSDVELGSETAYHPNRTWPTNVPTRATAVTAELGPIEIPE
jgi:hypothetical protein